MSSRKEKLREKISQLELDLYKTKEIISDLERRANGRHFEGPEVQQYRHISWKIRDELDKAREKYWGIK